MSSRLSVVSDGVNRTIRSTARRTTNAAMSAGGASSPMNADRLLYALRRLSPPLVRGVSIDVFANVSWTILGACS
jgi:hypothetical protein